VDLFIAEIALEDFRERVPKVSSRGMDRLDERKPLHFRSNAGGTYEEHDGRTIEPGLSTTMNSPPGS
jgi:hypothetical protein